MEALWKGPTKTLKNPRPAKQQGGRRGKLSALVGGHCDCITNTRRFNNAGPNGRLPLFLPVKPQSSLHKTSTKTTNPCFARTALGKAAHLRSVFCVYCSLMDLFFCSGRLPMVPREIAPTPLTRKKSLTSMPNAGLIWVALSPQYQCTRARGRAVTPMMMHPKMRYQVMKGHQSNATER